MREPFPQQGVRTGGFPERALPDKVAGAVAVFSHFCRASDHSRVKGDTCLFDARGHVVEIDQVVAVICGSWDQTRGQAVGVPLTLEDKGSRALGYLR